MRSPIRVVLPIFAALAAVAIPTSASAKTPIVVHLYQQDVNWALGSNANIDFTHGKPGLPTHLPVGTHFTLGSNVFRGTRLSHGGVIGPLDAYCVVISATQATCDEGFAVFPDGEWLTQVIQYVPNINGPLLGPPSENTWSQHVTVDLSNPFNAPITGGFFEWAGVKSGFQTAVPNGDTGTWNLTAIFYK